jgi:hypothetical protein
MMRKQFPLAPANVRTVQTSQGLSMDSAQMYLEKGRLSAEDYWMHLYVMLSRVRTLEQLLVWKLPGRTEAAVKNVLTKSIWALGPPAWVREGLVDLERLAQAPAQRNRVRASLQRFQAECRDLGRAPGSESPGGQLRVKAPCTRAPTGAVAFEERAKTSGQQAHQVGVRPVVASARDGKDNGVVTEPPSKMARTTDGSRRAVVGASSSSTAAAKRQKTTVAADGDAARDESCAQPVASVAVTSVEAAGQSAAEEKSAVEGQSLKVEPASVRPAMREERRKAEDLPANRRPRRPPSQFHLQYGETHIVAARGQMSVRGFVNYDGAHICYKLCFANALMQMILQVPCLSEGLCQHQRRCEEDPGTCLPCCMQADASYLAHATHVGQDCRVSKVAEFARRGFLDGDDVDISWKGPDPNRPLGGAYADAFKLFDSISSHNVVASLLPRPDIRRRKVCQHAAVS